MAKVQSVETSRNAIKPYMSTSARLVALIENAIAALDAIDGNPDIENDEPDEEHDGGEGQYYQAPDYGVDQTNISAGHWR